MELNTSRCVQQHRGAQTHSEIHGAVKRKNNSGCRVMLTYKHERHAGFPGSLVSLILERRADIFTVLLQKDHTSHPAADETAGQIIALLPP